ncbi:MAG: hypothetical protein CVU59_06160 [Deltaproteobacteria bacterium HGW-Deltaproteobacteria-17]|nr:MAG: hypothetical protein CVU59_06160 [Deltaproteobacteria bacterium HGW-Deltaproteobacteria-17]
MNRCCGPVRSFGRRPWFIVPLLAAAFLSAGNTYETLPLYPLDAISEDFHSREVADWEAAWVTRPAWSWMEPFFSGVALAASGGACENIIRCSGAKWGAVGPAGRWVVQPVWDRIRMVWDPVGFEVDSGGKKGLLNAAGRPWIPVRYEDVDLLDHGFVEASLSPGKADVFNPEGRQILHGVEFSSDAGPDRIWVRRGGKYALYDRSGRQVTPLRYSDFSPSPGPVYPVMVGRSWGMIDGRGKQLAPYAYAGISFLIGRLLTVNVGGTCDTGLMKCSGGRYGVMNLSGKLVLPARYTCVETADREDGTSEIRAMEDIAAMAPPVTPRPGDTRCTGGLWTSFDGQGRTLFPEAYSYIEFFREARLARAVKDGHCSEKGVCTTGKWGLLDRAGKVVTPFRYDWLDVPGGDNGTAFVIGRRWGLLDARLREVAGAKYEQVNVDGEAVRFREAGKWGVMDLTGRVIVQARHERILPFREKVARFSDKGRWGLLTSDGRVLVAATYTAICQQRNGTYAFSRSPGCSVPARELDSDLITPSGSAPIRRRERADDDCSCKDALFGLMDLTGRELLAPRHSLIRVDSALGVSEAVAKASTVASPVSVPPGSVWVRLNQGGVCDGRSCQGGKWGLADLRGRLLIPMKYAFVITEKDFLVRVAEGGTCDGLWFASRCSAGTKWGLMRLSPVAK